VLGKDLNRVGLESMLGERVRLEQVTVRREEEITVGGPRGIKTPDPKQ
jgi:hypothetical protein